MTNFDPLTFRCYRPAMKNIFLISVSTIFSLNVFAQTSTVSAPKADSNTTLSPTAETNSSASKIKELLFDKKFNEDKKITDLELRARSGSFSRYSMQFDLGYDGPGLSTPGKELRPNPDNRPGDFRTKMTGSIGFRYRISSEDAVSFATGLTWFNPIQVASGNAPDKNEIAKEMNVKDPGSLKEFDMNNPSASYDYTYSMNDWQMRNSLRGVYTTNKAFTDAGQVGSVRLGQVAKYFFGDRKLWVFGSDISMEHWMYSRGFDEKNKADRRVSNYQVQWIPGLEYRLTEKFNIQTSSALVYANQRAIGNLTTWERMGVTYRIGFGWAVTKEVLFKPYVHFPSIVDEGFRSESASLGLSTVFSIL